MPTPLKSRINVLITSKDKEFIKGADYYLSGNINDQIQNIQSEHADMDIFIIGGS